MYLWIAGAAWGLINLAAAIIDWRGRIRYERARATAAAVMSRAVAAGGTVHDQRRDGTVLHIHIPRQAGPGPGPGLSEAAGDGLAQRG